MAERPVLIVGAGIMGLCTAHYLARRGQATIVLEQELQVGRCASGGNAGILAYGHLPLPRPGLTRKALRWMLDPGSPLFVPPRWDPALWRWFWDFHRACTEQRVAECMLSLAILGKLAREGWREILAERSPACSLRQAGWLNVYRTAAGRREAEHEADVARRHGFAAVSLTAAELLAREPAFAGDVLGAVHYPESVSLDPAACLQGLAGGLQKDGVEIRTGAEVAALLVEGGRCRGVRLADGQEVSGQATVLAAGIWSAALARTAGIRLPLQGGKGYHLDLAHAEPRLRTAAVLTEAFVAVNPLQDRLRLAGTVEFSGLNHRLRERRLDMLARGAAGYLRGTAAARPLDRGCDLRPCLADGLLVVDWAPHTADLFLLAGGAKVGMTLGPACGRLAAECLLDGRPSLDITPLRADRF